MNYIHYSLWQVHNILYVIVHEYENEVIIDHTRKEIVIDK
jgi:hypothetical protein